MEKSRLKRIDLLSARGRVLFHGQCWEAQTCQCWEALADGCHGHQLLRHLRKQSDVSGGVELLARLRSLTKTQPSDHRGADARDTHQEDNHRRRARTPAASVIINRRPAHLSRKTLPICPPSSHRAVISSLRPVPGKDISACHSSHMEALISAGLPPGLPEGHRPPVTLFSFFWRL